MPSPSILHLNIQTGISFTNTAFTLHSAPGLAIMKKSRSAVLPSGDWKQTTAFTSAFWKRFKKTRNSLSSTRNAPQNFIPTTIPTCTFLPLISHFMGRIICRRATLPYLLLPMNRKSLQLQRYLRILSMIQSHPGRIFP